MKYKNMLTGIFLSRPNRFIAFVEIDGCVNTCHVKNTGRCRELLIPGVTVYVQKSDNPARKTMFSLIGVKKGERIINIDSQAPNKAVYEWLQKGGLFHDITYLKPEKPYGNSRFDFYLETKQEKIYMEVKGVTLENNGIVLFPDAPTIRGVKHIKELCQCRKEGYQAYLILVIQMKDVLYFKPNDATDPAFGEALREASKEGVHIMAMDCEVTVDKMVIRNEVPINLC
ncbi:DNA/RNA nuclease SfsA [Anaerocolumna sp. MB42-C2]|uniref:DNA/RNA nuclease SfsA n=1 Tax=Anaerocolumna sp. MB42-C2 TaxID=3070997 RepID=UPI0027E0F568|nr:DNA/RNA nuclease SfsA [Anaerocolumna sp. MB42-C2]WMJ90158.1 DNA/RNA nuclease SfsA [Anaerocolumna sp. MB42-C2]